MIYKKPASMKFVDCCIYIDANVPKIVNPGENPEIENTIYNYLWLLVKALAIKKCLFEKFEDYDGYAFYAANRLFFALRKNYLNQGKIIKGKQIRPIKSCLNYTKALLYPMKIEYQRETFKEVIEEEFAAKKFDAFAYKAQLKSSAKELSGTTSVFKKYLYDAIKHCGNRLDDLLDKSPCSMCCTPTERHNLKISVLLNSLYILKIKNKLDITNQQSITLWHLPKSMSSYVKVLLREFFAELRQEIMDCYREADLDDATLENILNSDLEVGYFEDQY